MPNPPQVVKRVNMDFGKNVERRIEMRSKYKVKLKTIVQEHRLNILHA